MSVNTPSLKHLNYAIDSRLQEQKAHDVRDKMSNHRSAEVAPKEIQAGQNRSLKRHNNQLDPAPIAQMCIRERG